MGENELGVFINRDAFNRRPSRKFSIRLDICKSLISIFLQRTARSFRELPLSLLETPTRARLVCILSSVTMAHMWDNYV